MPRHLLVADDQPGKLDHLAELSFASSVQGTVIHKASSAREALATVVQLGGQIDEAVIDFDFIGERETGADIIAAVRTANADSRITCATAREGSALEEARQLTTAAGADHVLCAVSDGFEEQMRLTLAS